MLRYSLTLAKQFSIRRCYWQASLIVGAPLFAVPLGWDARWSDMHRQLSEQAIAVQGFVSQQSTKGGGC